MTNGFAACIQIDPDLHTPLHTQIQDGLMRLIDAGELKGELPGPEQLARDLRVCGGSARRAYEDLVEAGIIELGDYRYRVVDFVS